MFHPFDHVLVTLFVVAWPLFELCVSYPRFKRAVERGVPGVRPGAYGRGMATQWTFAGLALFAWLRFRRPLAALGLGVPSGAGFLVAILSAIAIAAFLAWQNRMIAARPG